MSRRPVWALLGCTLLVALTAATLPVDQLTALDTLNSLLSLGFDPAAESCALYSRVSRRLEGKQEKQRKRENNYMTWAENPLDSRLA